MQQLTGSACMEQVLPALRKLLPKLTHLALPGDTSGQHEMNPNAGNLLELLRKHNYLSVPTPEVSLYGMKNRHFDEIALMPNVTGLTVMCPDYGVSYADYMKLGKLPRLSKLNVRSFTVLVVPRV